MLLLGLDQRLPSGGRGDEMAGADQSAKDSEPEPSREKILPSIGDRQKTTNKSRSGDPETSHTHTHTHTNTHTHTHTHTEVLITEYPIRASAFQASACDLSGPIYLFSSNTGAEIMITSVYMCRQTYMSVC